MKNPLPTYRISMAPRLLTLLNLIETALVNQGSSAVASPPARAISFHKGMARMSFTDGSGSIALQNFTLADGQICVRAILNWAESAESGTQSIYPREGFDWLGAADQIAGAWIAGKPPPVTAPRVTVEEKQAEPETDSSSEVVAATG
jgi:hypothetical protein